MRNKITGNVSARQNWALSRRQLLQAAVVQAVSLPWLPWLAADESARSSGTGVGWMCLGLAPMHPQRAVRRFQFFLEPAYVADLAGQELFAKS
jgi:hypothetical protein